MRTRYSMPSEMSARATSGRDVIVLAVPSGYTLRELSDGSGTLTGAAFEAAARSLQWAGAATYGRGRWTVGVVSADGGFWRGEQRLAIRRRVPTAEMHEVMTKLVDDIESGQLAISPRRRFPWKR